MEKLYSVTELLEMMGDQGLPRSRMWIYYNERSGRLICPRLPHGRRDRAFTLDQIHAIIREFSPGGKGYWKYEKKNSPAFTAIN